MSQANRRVRTAVFPVAGLGTRFLPATKAVPKELLPILDRPLLDYAIDEARAAGIEKFVFVTAPGKDAIAKHVGANPELIRALHACGKSAIADITQACELHSDAVHFVRQERALGLGHAIGCARALVAGEPFAVILPDDLVLSIRPCIAQVMDAYAQTGGNVAAVMSVPRAHTGRYGVLDVAQQRGNLVRARGLVEKPAPERAPSTLCIIGRYVLEPTIFEELEHGRRGAGGEIQITDAIAARIAREGFHGVCFEGVRFDCGSKQGFLQATVACAMADPDLAPYVREPLLDEPPVAAAS
jgi:UTP--glucose-1-phosphate uridylyltransferase